MAVETGTGTNADGGPAEVDRHDPPQRIHYLSTKHLVIIAVLSSLGGVLSTYVGYLGNLINRMVGVPFGAGQFMAGLHVVWIMLALGLTQKKGAATATGIVKGFVEFFMGSTHGIVIVIVSAVQGLIPDLVLASDRAKAERRPVPYSLAGGLAAMSNVLVFQAFYFSSVPWVLIAVLCMLAAGSGIIFGGWLPLQLITSIELAGLGPHPTKTARTDTSRMSRTRRSKPMIVGSVTVTVVFLASFTIGGVYYFSEVYVPPGAEGVQVTGAVEHSYTFSDDDFAAEEVTIRAELIGSVTYVAPKNYTGVPLTAIIEHARPKASATTVEVTAKDGYTVTFDLDDVLADAELIMTHDEPATGYRLIAANYDGAYWVEDCYKLEVR